MSVVLAALVIGCGGDSEQPSSDGADSSTSSEETTPEEPEALSEADLSNEADKICESQDKEVDKLLVESDKAQATAIAPETLTSFEATEKAAVEVGRIQDELAKLKLDTTKELAKLEAAEPALLEDLVVAGEEYATVLREVGDAWRSYGKKPTQKASDAIGTAQEAQVKSSAAEQKAVKKLDLKKCGQTVGKPE